MFWCFLVGLLVSCHAVPINNQEAHGYPHNGYSHNDGPSSNGAARRYLVGGVGVWPSFTPSFVGPGKYIEGRPLKLTSLSVARAPLPSSTKRQLPDLFSSGVSDIGKLEFSDADASSSGLDQEPSTF